MVDIEEDTGTDKDNQQYVLCGYFVKVGNNINSYFPLPLHANLRKSELEAAGWGEVKVIKAFREITP